MFSLILSLPRPPVLFLKMVEVEDESDEAYDAEPDPDEESDNQCVDHFIFDCFSFPPLATRFATLRK